MSMLGGSPIKVATPCKLEEIAIAMSTKTGETLNLLVIANAIGATIRTTATFSTKIERNPANTAIKIKTVEMLLMWVMVPISGIIFGSIPAIDAETRLMLGKYLGFHVTEKERKTIFAPRRCVLTSSREISISQRS